MGIAAAICVVRPAPDAAKGVCAWERVSPAAARAMNVSSARLSRFRIGIAPSIRSDTPSAQATQFDPLGRERTETETGVEGNLSTPVNSKT
jgi:hypothetical protein